MSKIRHPRGLPDGSVWVRTYPVTYLHDKTDARHDHTWHQLTYAVRGHLELITDDMRRIAPGDRAIWVPAGVAHAEVMCAPISMRSIYIAPAAARIALRCRTIAVTPLLRELILQISRIGALDRRVPAQARLVGVLLDQLDVAAEVPLELPLPRDDRARRFAELVTLAPGDDTAIAQLARRAGASLRTLERCFRAETGVAVGEWRRRVRLFHALRRLEAGATVTAVAAEVGYANPSTFCHAFRQQFGRTPGRRRQAGGTAK